MQVSIERTGALGRRMTVALPAERFEKAFSEHLRRLSKSVKLAGFRPGKVPLNIVEAQYGGRVLEEVAGELIQKSFYAALGEQGLRIAGGPRIEPKTVGRGKDFEYTATFEVYPEIKAVDLNGVAVERPVCEIADADVDATLESLRRQRVSWQPVERIAQAADRLTIDFRGSRDGEPVPGTSANAFPFVLGSGALLEGFESALTGVKTGDARAFDVTFPADYRVKALAGAQVHFDVDVKAVAEPVLPAVDEDLVRALGVPDGQVASLRAEIRKNLEREAQERVRGALKQAVFQRLLEANAVDVPDGLVRAEAERLLRLDRANLKAQGVDETRLPADETPYRGRARERVALGMILSEVVQAKGLKADPGKVRARLEAMASAYESPEEFMKWYYAAEERLAEIESMVLEDDVVDALLASMAVTDKQVSFSELTRSNAD